MPHLESYIGKYETFEEVISMHQVRKICATFLHPPLSCGDALPPLWLWCFFIELAPIDHLGRDGHAKLGTFMPPAENRNRMWAGGRFDFITPLTIGKKATKKTTIKAIKEKVGRTGKLMFVTLLHEYFQAENLCVSEEQDIVYKEASPPKRSGDIAIPASDYSETHSPNEVLLFRYSALTFNGHRIHYDFPYATQTEGYRGLVIHGPLLATYMINLFAKQYPTKKIKHYSYRGFRPLCVPSMFKVEGAVVENGVANVWVAEADSLAQEGKIIFE